MVAVVPVGGTYTVPVGKTFKIHASFVPTTPFNGVLADGLRLYNFAKTGTPASSSAPDTPIYVPGGSVLTLTNPALSQIFIGVFTNDEAVLFDWSPSKQIPYVVPAGKTLWVYTATPGSLAEPHLLVNGTELFEFNTNNSQPQTFPTGIPFGAGSSLTFDDNAGRANPVPPTITLIGLLK